MKNAIYLLICIAALAACKKKENPTPGNPNPKDYSVGRMPLPFWGTDTMIGAVIVRVNGYDSLAYYDSFITYNKGNETMLKYKGSEYSLWLDTLLDPYASGEFTYPRAFVSNSIKDSASIQAFRYHPNISWDKYGDTTYNLRWIIFYNPFLNKEVSINQWAGRWWGDGVRKNMN